MNVIASDMVMFYKKSILGSTFSKWKNSFFTLRSDGILFRYKDQDQQKEDGVMDIKNSSIIIGEDVIGLDDRPPLDLWMDGMLLMCIPYNEKSSWWLLFYNYQQLSNWMENIALILKANEVQKDFIVKTRLAHNNKDHFCQLKHTLKYRDEAYNIPSYSINLPPQVICENPPRSPSVKYDFDKIFNSRDYMKNFSRTDLRSDTDYNIKYEDDHNIDYRKKNCEETNDVQIPIRRSNSYDRKLQFNAKIMPHNLTSSSSGISKGILKKSRETINTTESSTITSSESMVRFLEPERIHMMSDKKPDDIRIRHHHSFNQL